LVLKAGVWYLVGRSDGETRIYRVSRLLTVTVTDESFERPAQFDLIAYWERSRDEFETSRPRVDVLVRVERRDVRALREAIDWSVRPVVDAGGVDSDGGRVEFLLPFERLESAYADLVKLGGAVEVREPSELRERLAQTGRELVARYPTRDGAPDGPSSVSAHDSAGGTADREPLPVRRRVRDAGGPTFNECSSSGRQRRQQ
jgi:predicted DNA-binding transcriptional regulator YafY